MSGVAVGAQGALDIHEQGLLNYGGLGCGRGPDQAIRTYRGPEGLDRKPEQDQRRLAIRRSRTTGAARELQGRAGNRNRTRAGA